MTPKPGAYDPATLAIGVFGRPHGVTGEISLRPYNARGRELASVREVHLSHDGRWTTHQLVGCRPVEGGYLCRLAGVGDRDAAAKLTLAEVRVARTALPPLAPGEYYVEDVLGCAVEDVSGRSLGVARGTFWNGAHDVMTAAGPDGHEHLIPLVPDFVLLVDGPGRKITVRWDPDDDDL